MTVIRLASGGAEDPGPPGPHENPLAELEAEAVELVPGDFRLDRAVEPLKPLVLGTAVATDGRSFATLQLGDGSPTLVHVGDKIGEWTVKSIQRG